MMIEDGQDKEDDTVDTSVVGKSTASESEDKSEDSEAAEEADAESEAEAVSSDDEASVKEAEHDAEGKDDNETDDSVRSAEGAEESTLADEDSKAYSIDREAEVTEEDKVGMRSPNFSDARVQAFIKDNKIDKRDYASFYKTLNMPKVEKHLTPEQSHHILQFIGKNLDLYNTTLPTTEEARSFLYFQKRLLLFISKEKKKKEKKGNGSKHKDGN
jgi:hypothetical protein